MPRRDPFREIEELFERMGREFEEFGAGLEPGVSKKVKVDLVETDDELVVTADLPGYDHGDIDVELRDDALTIAASHTDTFEEGTGGVDDEEDAEADDEDGIEAADGESEIEAADGPQYHRRERRQRSVSRRIPLPSPVDEEGTTATYNNGVLTVTLPKASPMGSDGHSIDVN